MKYEELCNINTAPYRRIIIFSQKEMYIFKSSCFYNYIKLEKLDLIVNSYLNCIEKTKKINLPYLFIFNKVDITDNETFLENSNWIVVEK